MAQGAWPTRADPSAFQRRAGPCHRVVELGNHGGCRWAQLTAMRSASANVWMALLLTGRDCGAPACLDANRSCDRDSSIESPDCTATQLLLSVRRTASDAFSI
jgi:hypothetical protein